MPVPCANALLVVAKRPEPGRTKTRLTPPLTPRQASDLYECFLRDTIGLMRSVPAAQPAVAYLPASEAAYFGALAPGFGLVPQEGESLGERLDNATAAFLARGHRRVAIMNSDGPTLPAAYLAQAFAELEDGADVVLGPSDDGGYYLIGMTRPCPRLLREVRMSTPHVLRDTLALAGAEGLRVALLPAWYDVDDLESLRRLREELARAPDGVAAHTRAFLARGGPWPW
jgi:hypothetical protein